MIKASCVIQHIGENSINCKNTDILLKQMKMSTSRPETGLNTINCDEAQALFVELDKDTTNSDQNIIVGVIYRPPSTNIDKFNTLINSTLNLLKTESSIVYLMGDFNLDLLKQEQHQQTGEFLDLLHSFSLLPLINKPTRITSKTATLIDNIFTTTKEYSNCVASGILVTDISDHYPIFHITKYSTNKTNHVSFKRDFSSTNTESFIQQIQNCNWAEITNNVSAPESFSHFYNRFLSIFHKSFPVKIFKTGYYNRNPWLTLALKKSIARKNWLFKISKSHSCYEASYKTYKNKLVKLLRKAEKDYYQDLLHRNKANLKKSWQIIKSVLNKAKTNQSEKQFIISGETVDDPTIISDSFNSFFTNIGPNLSAKLPVSSIDPIQYMSNKVDVCFNLDPVEEKDIKLIISNLKDSSAGTDEIPPKILKLVSTYILKPLTHNVNLSLTDGYFPDELKIAKVVPIFKFQFSSRSGLKGLSG